MKKVPHYVFNLTDVVVRWVLLKAVRKKSITVLPLPPVFSPATPGR